MPWINPKLNFWATNEQVYDAMSSSDSSSTSSFAIWMCAMFARSETLDEWPTDTPIKSLVFSGCSSLPCPIPKMNPWETNERMFDADSSADSSSESSSTSSFAIWSRPIFARCGKLDGLPTNKNKINRYKFFF